MGQTRGRVCSWQNFHLPSSVFGVFIITIFFFLQLQNLTTSILEKKSIPYHNLCTQQQKNPQRSRKSLPAPYRGLKVLYSSACFSSLSTIIALSFSYFMLFLPLRLLFFFFWSPFKNLFIFN